MRDFSHSTSWVFFVVDAPKGYLRSLEIQDLAYFCQKEVWHCNWGEMSTVQDTPRLLFRGHFRSFSLSLLSVKCPFKNTFFFFFKKFLFSAFGQPKSEVCTNPLHLLQSTEETKPLLLLSLLDNFTCVCLCEKFKHLKLNFLNFYLT